MSGVSGEIEALAKKTIGAAIEVHKALGPGYLESIYQEAMKAELHRRKIPFEYEHPIRITYKGNDVGAARLDLLIDGLLIVELKAVDQLHSIHRAQVLHYLEATRLPLALLLNFKVPRMKHGIKRIVLSKNSQIRHQRHQTRP